MKQLELKKYYTKQELSRFGNYMIKISDSIGFKVSSRGWCYILEGNRLINKDQFSKVEELINNCRRKGFLPIDFVAEEKAREFDGIEIPNKNTVVGEFNRWMQHTMKVDNYYTPDWWNGEQYYIQMVVEKVDLVTLFGPVCEEYHIPIANSKGWGSMLQRAEYARRFAQAQEKGLECVLLYCGDHDPDGLRISNFLRTNIDDLRDINWEDGTAGYDPADLIIERFGLNYDFIIGNNLTWIDNLVTGGGELARKDKSGKIVPGLKTKGKNIGKPHQNFSMEYLQTYLENYGVRKCEANAIVTQPDAARGLVRLAIEKYLGTDVRERFQIKRDEVKKEFNDWLTKNKLHKTFDKALRLSKKYDDENS